VDPGISLLTKIGDFVEPLTRFDRGHLTLHSSDHVRVEVAVRQVFKVMFAATPSSGNGQLPAGVIQVENAAALARAAEIQLATARTAVPSRLAAWAEQHGEDPRQRPAVADCFTPVHPVGYVETCQTCRGHGQVSCHACNGNREVTCSTCNGSGQSACRKCDATGQLRCNYCLGTGYRMVDRQESFFDQASNSTQYRTVQIREPCTACRNGSVECDACGGRTTVTCRTCHGGGRVTCSTCQGSGVETCATCEGKGAHFHTVLLSCAVSEALEISPRTQEPDVAAVLKSLVAIDDVLAYSDNQRATAEASNDTLRRDTVVTIPLTTVTVAVGAKQARVRGYGPGQEVRDYGNIAGMLLSDDLDILEGALPFTRAFPPKTTSEMESALSGVLASEVNASVAEHAGRKDMDAIVARLRGVVSADYVARAAPAIRKGVSRTYWSAMMRGPIAVLALPLLQIPLELLVRSQGTNGQIMAMLGMMLIAFGGGIIAHMLTVQQVQKRLRPDGIPKMSVIVGKLGLTLAWLATAAAWSVLITLAMSGITNAVFPVSPATPSLFPPV
jgi:hypothetical protein